MSSRRLRQLFVTLFTKCTEQFRAIDHSDGSVREPQIRLGKPGGHRSLIRKGIDRPLFADLYHYLIEIPWVGFFAMTLGFYLLVNLVFASAYMLEPNGIQNAQPGSFLDAFFFSFQTLATIGYGAMYPATVYTNLLAAAEALIGLLGFALITGLMFARISIPTARILFSRVAVILNHDGKPTLMFRAANQRGNQILEAQVRVTLARNEITAEGEFMRRLHDLKLVRSMTPIFALTWNVMHVLDVSSPLHSLTQEDLAKSEAELIITMTGIDDTVSQTVHARHSFLCHEILWDMRFADILLRTPDGRRYIDYGHFHDVVPASARETIRHH